MAMAMATTEEILSAVDAVQGEAVDFLRRIVSIDSTLEAGEGRVQSAIRDELVRALCGPAERGRRGFEVERLPVRLDDIRGRRGFSPVDWSYDDDQKFDVVARCPGAADPSDSDPASAPRCLLLQGHADVVPADASDGWTDPPFSPVVRDGRMYGRGAGDMKAGVVAMIYAAVALRRLGYLPRGEVAICTVVEEECTGNGALAAPLDSLLPSSALPGARTAVLIPEPFPFVVTAQLGVLWFKARVTGRPCHVLRTAAGCNAIEGAYALYSSLKKLEDRYNAPRGDAHPAFRGMDRPVNFNLGRIGGGNWASSVPSGCWFEARAGFLPGVEVEDVKRDVEGTLREAAEGLGLGVEVSYRGFHADGAVLLPEYVDGRTDSGGGGERSPQRELVETLRRCHSLATASDDDGGDPSPELPLKPITCTCDARFYSPLYQDPARVAVTCYGPEAANIHGVDESVSLESMKDVTATIALFIRDWCGLVREGRGDAGG